LKNIYLILTALILTALLPITAGAASEPRQVDLLKNLVDGLGWSFGLPNEPSEADYLTIVGSNRTLRIEAEDAYSESDFVSIKNFHNYGEFSGSGWVSGVNTPTLLHLDFLLPWSGTFSATAALRFPGYTFDFGDQLLIGSGAEKFTTVTLGKVSLEAGPHQVIVELPPNGSIDYLELSADQHPPIMPFAGWALDQSFGDPELAEISCVTLELLNLLPATDRSDLLEFESSPGLSETTISTHRHLGAPSGGAWVRAGIAPLEVSIPFETKQPEVLSFTLRGLGEVMIPFMLDGMPLAQLQFPPYLADRETRVVALPPGSHKLTTVLPPRAGLDSLTMNYRDASDAALLSLTGLAIDEASVADSMNQIIALLAGLAPVR